MKALIACLFLAFPVQGAAAEEKTPDQKVMLNPGQYMPTKPDLPKTPQERLLVVEAIIKADVAMRAERAGLAELKLKEKIAAAKENYDKHEYAAQALLKAKELSNAKYAAFNEAARLTSLYYGLVPPQTDLSKESGLPKNRYNVVPWTLRYSENEVWKSGSWRPRTREEVTLVEKYDVWQNGRRVAQAEVPAPNGETRRNGSISLFPQAFFRNYDPAKESQIPDPEKLAMAILHETSHWVDAAGQGGFQKWDTPESLFRSEERAYRLQADFALKLRRPDAALRALAEKNARDADKTKGMTREQVQLRYPGMPIPDERRSLSPTQDGGPDNPEYLRIENELKFLESARRIKREKEQAERIGRAREEQRRIDEEAQRVKKEAAEALDKSRREEHLLALQGIAKMICSDCSRVGTEGILGRLNYYEPEFYQSRAHIGPGVHLQCHGELYNHMLIALSRGMKLDFTSLELEASQTYEKKNKTEGEKVLAEERLKEERRKETLAYRDWLKSFAQRICDNSSSLSDEDRGHINLGYSRLMLYGWMIGIRNPEDIAQDQAGCPRDLLLRLAYYARTGYFNGLQDPYGTIVNEVKRRHQPSNEETGGDSGKEPRSGSGGTCPKGDGGSYCRWRNRPR